VLHVRVREGGGDQESSTAATDRAAALMEQADEVDSVTIERGTILATLVPDVMDYTALPSMLIEHGFRIELFREEDDNLDTAFMQLTKGLVQ